MLIARTLQELRQATRAIRQRHASLVLVPTMGALHAGHLSLVTHAQTMGGAVVSIYVNPLQFNRSDDLDRYPRDEAGDLAALAQAGCDGVWLPVTTEMYAADDATTIDIAGPAIGWEGDSRPSHFRGVATVVTKLFGQVGPDIACFGEKDWQQLQVVRRVANDLALNVKIAGVATLREPDGLALSSRNRFLTVGERQIAPFLHATLTAVRDDLAKGVMADAALDAARARLADRGFSVDYLAVVNGETMRETTMASRGTRLIVAAQLGSVRLLDNIAAD